MRSRKRGEMTSSLILVECMSEIISSIQGVNRSIIGLVSDLYLVFTGPGILLKLKKNIAKGNFGLGD